MCLKVRFIRGRRTFLRTGRLWYQKVLVGEFMRSRLPWASSSFTGSICRQLCFPRASLCLKMKSRAAPRETEAMGHSGSSSFSSSRCSPMWSWPSLYLVRDQKHCHNIVFGNWVNDVMQPNIKWWKFYFFIKVWLYSLQKNKFGLKCVMMNMNEWWMMNMNTKCRLHCTQIWCMLTHLLTKTKLNVCPVVFVTASRMVSRVGVHGQAERITPE